MKKLLLVLYVGLLLVGCGGDADLAVETPDWDDPKVLEEIQSQALAWKHGVTYATLWTKFAPVT